MAYEARITVHQRGNQKPDYNDIHRRMLNAGYSRVRTVGGYGLSELHGMYNKAVSFGSSIDAEQSAIEASLRTIGFAFSIELFQTTNARTFNLEPATDYASLLGSLYPRR